jgi:hypothetical protein
MAAILCTLGAAAWLIVDPDCKIQSTSAQ